MASFADLHIHTYYSDGTSSSEEVVEEAHSQGLSCIAITDHDTIEGFAPTLEAAKKYNIEVIPGMEFSTEINGKDIHVLGYLFDCHNPQLKEILESNQAYRIERMRKMIGRLKDLGIKDIDLDEVCARVQSKSVGRPHLAATLVEKGVVKNIKEAFDKYLAEGAPAYFSKFKQTPFEAVSLIKNAGGVAVLAHPMLTQVDELIPRLVREGLGGLEVYYPNSLPSIVQFYERIAEKHNLVMTGGSDAHGKAKKHTYIGRLKIPYELVEKLKERAHA